MSDPIKRVETTHIDEVTRTATGTVQWFAEKRNQSGQATHPITHNNQLQFFICGEEGFRDIAEQIKNARESIDLCCWGFDPGMELVRNEGNWPRGETYGDLLIEAGKRGVQVRLLIWYDGYVTKLNFSNPKNMPGFTHDTSPWDEYKFRRAYSTDLISAQHSLMLRRNEGDLHLDVEIARQARIEYCARWYKAARNGLLSNVHLRTRSGDSASIKRSLASEAHQPGSLSDLEVEGVGMSRVGTHHQKPVLIDYAYNQGEKAVGYVMGLNSVTDYWCTTKHKLEDDRRERGGGGELGEAVQDKPGDPGFHTLKPYQDYACRISGGAALNDLYKNFVTAWDRAIDDRTHSAESACTNKTETGDCHDVPTVLKRKAQPGDSTVQIVRTQPEEGPDKTIEEVYFQATDIAALGAGYIYVENQYFQYEDWSQRLVKKRKEVIAGWRRGCAKAGKTMEDMPILHVFIVTPVPERLQMVPRTYDTLAVLGQQDAMTGQTELIKKTNAQPMQHVPIDEFGNTVDLPPSIPSAVQHANQIEKPTAKVLEESFGLKVCAAMLQTCAFQHGHWRYREIYIHSKLLLIDDGFITLGSANLNQRSMAVDSEINIATNDPRHAADLRQRVWSQHSGGMTNGGGGTPKEISVAFKDWRNLANQNKAEKLKGRPLVGFLLPLEDNRSCTVRIG